MTAHSKRVNPGGDSPSKPVAPLRNVQLFSELLIRLQDRPAHLGESGWGVFSGPSGWGKTTAAEYAALRSEAIYLECGSTWTASTLVDGLMAELNMMPMRAGVARKVQEIIKVLAYDPQPIMLDEADHLVKKSIIDVIREISDKSGCAVILIGEVHLPDRLLPFERAHNRVLEWVEAEGCNLSDARALAKLFSQNIEIADDLLARVVSVTDGTVRRVVTNIDRIVQWAKRTGKQKVDLASWDQEIYSGLPPRAALRQAKIRAARGAK